MRIAVLDIGTNSLRFEISKLPENPLGSPRGSLVPEVIYRERHMPRLGASLYDRGELDREAKQAAVAIATALRRQIDIFKPDLVAAAATCAFREASDGQAFINQLSEAFGRPIKIISGEDEARITAEGILAFEPVVPPLAVLIDIGGGSTEFSYCKDRVRLESLSLPLGAVRANQAFLRRSSDSDFPPEEQKIDQLRQYILDALSQLPAAFIAPEIEIIGSSGTVRSLCALSFEGKRANGSLSVDELDRLTRTLCTMNFEQTVSIEGMERNRADIITAGAIIAAEILHFCRASSLRASKFSLRHGLILQALQEQPLIAKT